MRFLRSFPIYRGESSLLMLFLVCPDLHTNTIRRVPCFTKLDFHVRDGAAFARCQLSRYKLITCLKVFSLNHYPVRGIFLNHWKPSSPGERYLAEALRQIIATNHIACVTAFKLFAWMRMPSRKESPPYLPPKRCAYFLPFGFLHVYFSPRHIAT